MSACRLSGCETEVAALGHLLCAEHWKRVPKGAREAYYRAKWQAEHGRDGSQMELERTTLAVLEAAT